MCGIVGIIGRKEVADRLVMGLRRLEYRGYDSAGIAVAEGGQIGRRRAKGKIRALSELLDDDPLSGRLGIAHTRWATHGAPSEANAHPHQAGRAVIVHNGIIENFNGLRRELEAAGRRFESETDSEVIAQLLDSHLEDGLDAEAAFHKTLSRLAGAYAIAAMVAGEPDKLFGARKGSPLVIGHGDGEMYLGSDAIALARLTRKVTYLEEGDWAVLGRDEARIFDAAGAPVERRARRSEVDASMIERGDYAHFMLKEIHEQPETLARTAAPYLFAGGEDGVRLPDGIDALFAEADRAVAVACGTGFYACQVAKYWFEGLAGLALETDIASEFRYRRPVLPKTGPALFVSQSGETADTLAALRYCAERGVPSVAVVNVPESSIAREAGRLLPTAVGPEIGVASTKAFTAQLLVLAATAVAAAKARGEIDAEEARRLAASLQQTPRLVAEALTEEPAIMEAAASLAAARDILYLGRERYFPLALEGALKMKEISYIHAEGYAAGELKHGPIALIEDGSPVVVVAPHDALFEKTMSNVEEVRARGARVILISDDAGLDAAGARADVAIRTPMGDALTAPIVASVPLQLLAYHTALAKGCDIDQPRNLAKSVTVE